MKDFTAKLKTVEGMLSDAYDQGYADGLMAAGYGEGNDGQDGQDATEPTQPINPIEPTTDRPAPSGRLLHRVGLISDIHFDVEDNSGTEYAGDLINALAYFRNQGVAFISSLGDYGQYDIEDWQMFHEYYNAHGWAPSRGELRLFTAVGNHDAYQLLSKSLIGDELRDIHIGKTKKYWNDFTGEANGDMHFFEYGGHWNEQRTGNRTNESKLSYWYERDGVMYVYLSIDYGEDPNLCWGMMTMACNKLDYTNDYVKQMEDYTILRTLYKRETNDPFNYQFYHPNLLIWLYELIRDNADKRIVISMHHFFPQKSGNGTAYTAGGNFYSKDRLWPYSDEFRASTVKANSNTLCGLEFWFLNCLANSYKNTVWISGGHSHYALPDEDENMDVCFHDFAIYKPDGTERMTDYGKAENFDNVVFCRASDTPTSTSAPCIHLPSLAKPVDRATNKVLPGASQGAMLEVYEDGMVLKFITFKRDGEMTYCNQVIKSVNL